MSLLLIEKIEDLFHQDCLISSDDHCVELSIDQKGNELKHQ